MTTSVTDYVNVSLKLADLGCNYPQGLSLLPVNFESASSITDFLQASEAATIRKLLVAEGLPLNDIVERNQRPPYIKNKSHEWAAPLLFVSAALYSQNEALVSVALNVLGNYATDFFKGQRGTDNVRLDIVVEKAKNKSCKKISYEGPVGRFKDLADVVREVMNE